MNGFNAFFLLFGLNFGAFAIACCWCGKQFYNAVRGVELDECAKTRLYEGYSIVGTHIITFSRVMAALSIAAFGLLALGAGVNQAHGLETSMASVLLKYALCDAVLCAVLHWLFVGPLSKLAWNPRYRPFSYVDNKADLKLIRFAAGCFGFGSAVAVQNLLALIG